MKDKVRKKIAKITSYIVLAVVLFMLIYVLEGTLVKRDKDKRFETIKIGNQIIESLDKYHSIHGQYPESLDKLGHIPEPKWGEGWLYEYKDNKHTYELLTGHKKKNGYGPALYYDNEDKSSGWLYFDQDDSIDVK
jgi:hypothetical protein